MFRGWVVACDGEFEAGIAELRRGLEMWQAAGGKHFVPFFIAMEAAARHATGQPAEPSLELLNEAIARTDESGEVWYEAELHRLKGECLLSLPTPDQAGAEAAFVHAVEVARALGTKMWELRAATTLARLWRDQGKPIDACGLLAPVYAWFTEGFDTPDLRDAAGVLHELRH